MIEVDSNSGCPNCGLPAPDDDLECRKCGTSLRVNLALTGPVSPGLAPDLVALLGSYARFPPARMESQFRRGRGLVARGLPRSEALRLLNWARGMGISLEIHTWRVLRGTDPGPSFPWTHRRLIGGVVLTMGVLFAVSLAALYHLATRLPEDAGIGWRSTTVRPGRIVPPQDAVPGPVGMANHRTGGTFSEALWRYATGAVVRIETRKGVGSGFFVDSSGLVVTNYHVISGGGPLSVFSGGQSDLATVVRWAPSWDLALLKVNLRPASVLPIADGTRTRIADPVFNVGSAEGLDGSIRPGYVSYIGRSMAGISTLETDVAATHGNSGGPMLNFAGQVVGILNSVLIDSPRTSYSVLSNYLFDGPDSLFRSRLLTRTLSPTFLALQLRSLADVGPSLPELPARSASQAFVTGNSELAVVLETEPIPPTADISRPLDIEVRLFLPDGTNIFQGQVVPSVSDRHAAGAGPANRWSALYFSLPLGPEVHQALISAGTARLEVWCDALQLRRRLGLRL